MSSMLKEFKAFMTRGNAIDLAVAFVLGAAFGRVITSLIQDVLMPPIGLALAGVDFANLFVPLRGGPYPSLAAAKAAGAPTINYGLFTSALVDFVIVAAVLFLSLRALNRFRQAPEATPTTKPCPHCLTTIPLAATRCPACTSDLRTAAPA